MARKPTTAHSKQPKPSAANSPKKGRGKTVVHAANSNGAAKRVPGRPFQKGVSGNPSGRPKESEDLKALARSYTTEAVERLAYWLRSDNPKASVAAASILLDRAYGKATQSLSVEGDTPLIQPVINLTIGNERAAYAGGSAGSAPPP